MSCFTAFMLLFLSQDRECRHVATNYVYGLLACCSFPQVSEPCRAWLAGAPALDQCAAGDSAAGPATQTASVTDGNGSSAHLSAHASGVSTPAASSSVTARVFDEEDGAGLETDFGTSLHEAAAMEEGVLGNSMGALFVDHKQPAVGMDAGGATNAVNDAPPPALPGKARADDGAIPWSTLSPLIEKHAQGLFAAVRAGDGPGTLHAQRLSSALLLAGPLQLRSALFDKPSALSGLVGQLLKCFALEPAGAALWLHAPPSGGAAYLNAPPVARPPGRDEHDEPAQPGDTSGQRPAAGGCAPYVAQSVAQPSANDQPATYSGTAAGSGFPAALRPTPALPRMPPALAHLATQRAYAAVAGVARALGHAAALAGGGSLRVLADDLVGRLRGCRLGQAAGGAHTDAFHPPGTAPLALAAASALALSVEVLFGASAAWQPPLQPEGAAAAEGGAGTAGTGLAPGAATGGKPAVGSVNSELESICLYLLQVGIYHFDCFLHHCLLLPFTWSCLRWHHNALCGTSTVRCCMCHYATNLGRLQLMSHVHLLTVWCRSLRRKCRLKECGAWQPTWVRRKQTKAHRESQLR